MRTALEIAVVVLLVLGLLVAFGWWRYQRVYLHDDYVRGYTLGEHWNAHDRKGSCAVTARRLYDAQPGARGSAAFRAGCDDGLAGLSPVGWNMRERMQMMAD